MKAKHHPKSSTSSWCSQCLQSFLVSLGLPLTYINSSKAFISLIQTHLAPPERSHESNRSETNIPLKPNLGNGEVEGLRRKLVSWREAVFFWAPVLHGVSWSPMLTLGTNPGGKRRGSCWTRRATLPPFCLASRWRSRRC